MSESISSPPFPLQTINSRGLYRMLELLRLWLAAEQEELRDVVPPSLAAKMVTPVALESEARWEQVSVPDKFAIYVMMQDIRRYYDSVLREFESVWDSRPALRRREMIVRFTQFILSEAFVHPEKREMQLEQVRERMQKTQEAFTRQLQDLALSDPSGADYLSHGGGDDEDDEEAAWDAMPE